MSVKSEVINNNIGKLLHCFRENGIRQYNMNDVAEILDVSKKTLYKYVGNKKEVVEMVLKYEADLLHDMSHELLDKFLIGEKDFVAVCKEGTQNLIAISATRTDKYLDDLNKYHAAEFKQFELQDQKTSIGLFYKMFKIGVKEGYIRSDIDIDMTAKFLYANIRSIMSEKSLFDNYTVTSDSFYKTFWNYNLGPLFSSKGAAVIQESLTD